MHSNIFQHDTALTLSLMRKGEPLQRWDAQTTVNGAIVRHRGLAFEALRRLVVEINR
jgi:hypothetical protein